MKQTIQNKINNLKKKKDKPEPKKPQETIKKKRNRKMPPRSNTPLSKEQSKSVERLSGVSTRLNQLKNK